MKSNRNQGSIQPLALCLRPILFFATLALLPPLVEISNAQDPGGDLPFASGSDGSDGILDYPNNIDSRYHFSMAYDAARGQTVLFGGYDTSVGYSNDTYVFDGYEWTLLDPATSPPARSQHKMVWDSEREVVVLFGGSNSTYLNDTWTWDGTTWTQESPTTSPSGREDFAMAFDEVNNLVLLYGGANQSDTYWEDTWAWNGTDWTELSPTTNPGGRRYHEMAYDTTNGQLILYGGYKNGSWSSETWLWTGTDWSLSTTSESPGPRYQFGLSNAPNMGGIIFFGGYYSGYHSDTWIWDGTDWTELNPTQTPTPRYRHSMCYDENLEAVIVAAGSLNSGSSVSNSYYYSEDDWVLATSGVFYFDMSEKPDGIWNYTSVHIPENIVVRFLKNPANTPVFWLATEDIVIDGSLILDGEDGTSSAPDPGNEASGGPGGFDGGLGGVRYEVSGSYAGTPGQGPGGGDPGVTSGENGDSGTYRDVYGNVALVPLYGGSGGGGEGSTNTSNGGNGGAGGGAILLATSKNVVVDGFISARGGDGYSGGGNGSGGAVRIVADRVTGEGNIDVRNGANSQSSPYTGYIRIEAYYRPLVESAGYIYPAPSAGGPSSEIGTVALTDQPALSVVEVAGSVVAQPPSGSATSPDVVFMESGSITVKVEATNIPDGTPITLRITTSGQVITLPGPGNPVVALSGGEATFTVFVPAGLGSIQAFAEFTPE